MIQKLITKYENLSKALDGFETKGLVDNFLADLHKLQSKDGKLPIPLVSNSYCGEQGEENMKADIKEIMHAAGDKFDFLRLCNEAQEELDEAAFDLDQESRMNGV